MAVVCTRGCLEDHNPALLIILNIVHGFSIFSEEPVAFIFTIFCIISDSELKTDQSSDTLSV